MSSRVLILEDDPSRVSLLADCFGPHRTVSTADPARFLALAAQGNWSLLCLDFDLDLFQSGLNSLAAITELGDPKSSAYKACAHCPVLVHSLNLRRAHELVGALWQWEGPIVRVPLHLVPTQWHWLERLIG
jgi:hypothetical protein